MVSASSMGEAFLRDSIGVLPNSSFPLTLQTSLSLEECAHFWLIESPNGPTSDGVCKLCGEYREFRNSMYSSTWTKGVAKRSANWDGQQ